MKSDLAPPAKKRKHSVRLFIDVITYRLPLPVTKVIAYISTTYPICPRCNLSLEREYMSFCDRCGQKLNWDIFEYAKVIHLDCRRE